MIAGLCQVKLHLPGNRSLKGKRQIVRRLCDRIRHKFHISVAEVGNLDQHQSSIIGFAIIGNETAFVQSVLDQVLNAIEQMQLAPIIDTQSEILHYNEQFNSSNSDEQPSEDAWGFMDEWRNS